jgi:hypothetical protein
MTVAERAAAAMRADGWPTGEDYQRLERWMRYLARVRRGVEPAPLFWLGADADPA